MDEIDPTLPLYIQLKKRLASQIASGRLQPQHKLPSERELSSSLGVSRMTVRHAISLLAQEGLVHSRPGKGVYVSPACSQLKLAFSLTGYSEVTTPVSDSFRGHLVGAKLSVADDGMMAALGLGVPEEVVVIERLRYLQDLPIAHQQLLFPHRLCPGLLRHDLSIPGSMLEYVRTRYQLKTTRAEQTIRAASCLREDMAKLNLEEAVPLLSMERKTYLQDGQVVEYSRSTYRGDCLFLQLSLDISRAAVGERA